MRVLLPILLMLFVAVSPADAAIKRVGATSKVAIVVDKYEVVDISFVAKEKVVNPFDVELKVAFVSPTGVEYRVVAFYNGDNEWVARFSGSEVGEWSYTTSSELRSLSGKRGLLTISQESYRGRRGAVKVSGSSSSNFVREDGSPYFMLSFGCEFLYALDYHNAEGAPNLEHFVKSISSQGFNAVSMSAYAYDVEFEKDSKLSRRPQYCVGGDQSIYPFWGSNAEPNHAVLNVNYFKRLDRTIEMLNDYNVVANVSIYNWNTDVNWAEEWSEEDNQYFDYVVRRYQAFSNVVWCVASGMDDEDRDEFVGNKISRLRDIDSFSRLLSVGDDGFCERHKTLIDFVTVETPIMEQERKAALKPVLSIGHGGYEECEYSLIDGVYVDAQQCLKRSYEVIFGGAYTTYYWQGAAWSLLIYDFDLMTKSLLRPMVEYYRYLKGLFAKYPLTQFRRVDGLSDTSLCMTDGDRSYLLYVNKELHAVKIDSILSKGSRFLYQWFNTTTGEYSDVEVRSGSNAQIVPQNPYYMERDAVLIVKILE